MEHQESAVSVRELVLEHERLLRGPGGLMEWRAEIRGMITLVKFGVGTSMLSAIVSIWAILERIR